MAEKLGTKERESLRGRGPIRVTIPASVAFDPDQLKDSIRAIMDRAGCSACCSGFDVHFQMERDFAVGLKSKLAAREAPLPHGHDAPSQRHFDVALSPSISFDIDRVFVAIDRVIDKIGPHPCISGFDVLFTDELRTIAVSEDLVAQRFDQRF